METACIEGRYPIGVRTVVQTSLEEERPQCSSFLFLETFACICCEVDTQTSELGMCHILERRSLKTLSSSPFLSPSTYFDLLCLSMACYLEICGCLADAQTNCIA